MPCPSPYFLVNGDYLVIYYDIFNSYFFDCQVKFKSTVLHIPHTGINEIILIH